MKNSTFNKTRYLSTSLLIIIMSFPILLSAQEDDDERRNSYYAKKSTWEETVRLACDKLNNDWNHKEGKFNFVVYYRHNWDTFYDEVKSVLRRANWEFPGEDRLAWEIEDRIWQTDRKSGDYKPLAVKMAWKIEHDFRDKAVEIAEKHAALTVLSKTV